MISLIPFQNFDPKFEVALCVVESNGKILVLQRQDYKPQGSQFGLPAGKVNSKEIPLITIKRELYEETGFTLQEKDFYFVKKVYARYSDYDLIFYIFKVEIENLPKITINQEEHKRYQWVTPQETARLENAKEDLDECTKITIAF